MNERIVKQFNCDETSRLVSKAFKTTITVTNKRIIRKSVGKKWGRETIFRQDVGLENIAGFSSTNQMLNKFIFIALIIFGLASMIVGFVFYGIKLAESPGQDPMLLINIAPTYLSFGLFIIVRGRKLGRGGQYNGFLFTRIMMYLTGGLFVVTGVYLFAVAIWDPELLEMLMEYLRTFESMVSMIFPPFGILLIGLALKIKPFMNFTVHVKYTPISFNILRRNTLFESFLGQNQSSVKLKLSPTMVQMFDELPAIVQDIKEYGDYAVEIWNMPIVQEQE